MEHLKKNQDINPLDFGIEKILIPINMKEYNKLLKEKEKIVKEYKFWLNVGRSNRKLKAPIIKYEK